MIYCAIIIESYILHLLSTLYFLINLCRLILVWFLERFLFWHCHFFAMMVPSKRASQLKGRVLFPDTTKTSTTTSRASSDDGREKGEVAGLSMLERCTVVSTVERRNDAPVSVLEIPSCPPPTSTDNSRKENPVSRRPPKRPDAPSVLVTNSASKKQRSKNKTILVSQSLLLGCVGQGKSSSSPTTTQSKVIKPNTRELTKIGATDKNTISCLEALTRVETKESVLPDQQSVRDNRTMGGVLSCIENIQPAKKLPPKENSKVEGQLKTRVIHDKKTHGPFGLMGFVEKASSKASQAAIAGASSSSFKRSSKRSTLKSSHESVLVAVSIPAVDSQKVSHPKTTKSTTNCTTKAPSDGTKRDCTMIHQPALSVLATRTLGDKETRDHGPILADIPSDGNDPRRQALREPTHKNLPKPSWLSLELNAKTVKHTSERTMEAIKDANASSIVKRAVHQRTNMTKKAPPLPRNDCASVLDPNDISSQSESATINVDKHQMRVTQSVRVSDPLEDAPSTLAGDPRKSKDEKDSKNQPNQYEIESLTLADLAAYDGLTPQMWRKRKHADTKSSTREEERLCTQQPPSVVRNHLNFDALFAPSKNQGQKY